MLQPPTQTSSTASVCLFNNKIHRPIFSKDFNFSVVQFIFLFQLHQKVFFYGRGC